MYNLKYTYGRAMNKTKTRPRGYFVERGVPGDGACLFHSIGAHVAWRAPSLRAMVASLVHTAPSLPLNGATLADWIAWETGMTADAYAAHIAQPAAWGGALEMTLLARLFTRDVHVYVVERNNADGAALKCITRVPHGRRCAARGGPITLLYSGRAHYTPLFWRSSSEEEGDGDGDCCDARQSLR